MNKCDIVRRGLARLTDRQAEKYNNQNKPYNDAYVDALAKRMHMARRRLYWQRWREDGWRRIRRWLLKAKGLFVLTFVFGLGILIVVALCQILIKLFLRTGL